ncbi:hypothetical protein D5018_09145 [Parashewanella curva]|uniref:Uncharacterized protein n=1 Tax=Parashewanella curva TaxID=2338552 RepID=A0A3L8PZE3_9GAMM|nr:hypothetical protein D5018_09145 [Parashewanella curva]
MKKLKLSLTQVDVNLLSVQLMFLGLKVIPITVIKCSTQSCECGQSTIEIDVDIVFLRQSNFEQEFDRIQAPKG